MMPWIASIRILLLAAGFATLQASPSPSEDELDSMWHRFKSDFGREYAFEEARRFVAFKVNVMQALKDNEDQGVICEDLFDDERCIFGITKFSDMFEDEFKATHMGYKRSSEPRSELVLSLEGLNNDSATVDWRSKGAVTPVKNQGNCGSCWAFSATEEIETAVFMATGKLETLSTQQIISCDKTDLGCNGGDTVTAYKYVEKAGGIDLASDYPDKSHKTGRTGKCTWDKEKDAKVTGFTYATKPCNHGQCKNQDEDAVATALAAKGPVSVCVNAGGNGWQNYKRGIYSKKCSAAASQIDHCVQLVGYDKSGATPYWILRNSWDTDWGMSGYMHLEMGENLCGVANEATIVQATTEAGIVTV